MPRFRIHRVWELWSHEDVPEAVSSLLFWWWEVSPKEDQCGVDVSSFLSPSSCFLIVYVCPGANAICLLGPVEVVNLIIARPKSALKTPSSMMSGIARWSRRTRRRIGKLEVRTSRKLLPLLKMRMMPSRVSIRVGGCAWTRVTRLSISSFYFDYLFWFVIDGLVTKKACIFPFSFSVSKDIPSVHCTFVLHQQTALWYWKYI